MQRQCRGKAGVSKDQRKNKGKAKAKQRQNKNKAKTKAKAKAGTGSVPLRAASRNILEAVTKGFE